MVHRDFPLKFGTSLKKYYTVTMRVNYARALLKAIKMVFLSNASSARGRIVLKLNKSAGRYYILPFFLGKTNKKLITIHSFFNNSRCVLSAFRE